MSILKTVGVVLVASALVQGVQAEGLADRKSDNALTGQATSEHLQGYASVVNNPHDVAAYQGDSHGERMRQKSEEQAMVDHYHSTMGAPAADHPHKKMMHNTGTLSIPAEFDTAAKRKWYMDKYNGPEKF